MTKDINDETVPELDVFDPDEDAESSVALTEYDLVSTPNDFNVMTIKSFLESGAVKIPRYQRNYVWDRARASKLIESLILGLPVPQVFLYEEGRNSFQIIDGQQRLMSIYFFLVGRFPKKKAKPLLREFWAEKGAVPASILYDDEYFEPFKLLLKTSDDQQNVLNGENFETLGDRQTQLSMRPLRNVIIKQVSPAGRGAVYEIFNRLNTTGVNLTPQEIRVSLTGSHFMEQLFALNEDENWRSLLGVAVPDARLKDLEILLRALAMADTTEEYRPSMVRFLNAYADTTRSLDIDSTRERFNVIQKFFEGVSPLSREPFLVSNRFSVPIFEAVFSGFARAFAATGTYPQLTDESLTSLTTDVDFIAAASNKTTDKRNVDDRIRLATEHFSARR